MSDEGFVQPELDNDMARSIPLKNQEIKKGLRAYAIFESEPSGRFGVLQLQIRNNKVEVIKSFYHLEEEKDPAVENLLKVMKYEEKWHV